MAEYRYIYGPVSSWRLGSSLGIDLLSQEEKICNFNCLYCQLGVTKRQTIERKIYVPVEKVPDLTTIQISTLKNNHFKKFSSEQVAVLTTDQVQAINTTTVNVKTLSDDQLHTLTDDQVINMKQNYYNKVKDRLTPEQQALR